MNESCSIFIYDFPHFICNQSLIEFVFIFPEKSKCAVGALYALTCLFSNTHISVFMCIFDYGRMFTKQFVAKIEKASPNIVIALAGNKADLTNSRTVEFEEAKQYAEENGLLFMETSAKTAMNVNDIFLAIGT